jgi:hypothetical protein
MGYGYKGGEQIYEPDEEHIFCKITAIWKEQ